MIRRAWLRATRSWRDAARIIAEEQALALTAPAPGAGQPRPVPGTSPGAGAAASHRRPYEEAAVTPTVASSGTGPQLAFTIHVYTDGSGAVYDYKNLSWTPMPPPRLHLDLSDDRIERFIRGQG